MRVKIGNVPGTYSAWATALACLNENEELYSFHDWVNDLDVLVDKTTPLGAVISDILVEHDPDDQVRSTNALLRAVLAHMPLASFMKYMKARDTVSETKGANKLRANLKNLLQPDA